MYLSVIIPAYKEEQRIPKTLDKVREFLSKQSYDWEVIVVNDGSPDKTSEVVAEKIKGWDTASGQFRLIDNKVNKGKGGVVKQGLLAAQGDWRLIMDADSSTDIKEIEKLLPFSNEFECIIGSRYLKKDSIKVKQPFYRRAISRIGNILIQVLLGIKSVDTQCGFKLYSGEFVKKVVPLQQIMRWGFDSEILAIGIKKGYKIKEVAVDWYDDERTTVKKSAAFQTLKEIFAIKWNMIRGRYS
jgi:dolichyl-phosphate beta-glucosyltransferase